MSHCFIRSLQRRRRLWGWLLFDFFHTLFYSLGREGGVSNFYRHNYVVDLNERHPIVCYKNIMKLHSLTLNLTSHHIWNPTPWHRRTGQRHRVMSYAWLHSATAVTPDQVWHGLVAVHGCCYKCNATAPSFNIASFWFRLHSQLSETTHASDKGSTLKTIRWTCVHGSGVVVLLWHWFSWTACVKCSVQTVQLKQISLKERRHNWIILPTKASK